MKFWAVRVVAVISKPDRRRHHLSLTIHGIRGDRRGERPFRFNAFHSIVNGGKMLGDLKPRLLEI